jgi:hypothetical protein
MRHQRDRSAPPALRAARGASRLAGIESRSWHHAARAADAPRRTRRVACAQQSGARPARRRSTTSRAANQPAGIWHVSDRTATLTAGFGVASLASRREDPHVRPASRPTGQPVSSRGRKISGRAHPRASGVRGATDGTPRRTPRTPSLRGCGSGRVAAQAASIRASGPAAPARNTKRARKCRSSGPVGGFITPTRGPGGPGPGGRLRLATTGSLRPRLERRAGRAPRPPAFAFRASQTPCDRRGRAIRPEQTRVRRSRRTARVRASVAPDVRHTGPADAEPRRVLPPPRRPPERHHVRTPDARGRRLLR